MNKKSLLTVGKIATSIVGAFFQIGVSKEENRESYDKGYNQGFQDYPRMLAENAQQTDKVVIQLDNGDRLVVQYEKFS